MNECTIWRRVKSEIKKSSKTDIVIIQVGGDRALDQVYVGKGKKSTKLRTILERAKIGLFDGFDARVKQEERTKDNPVIKLPAFPAAPCMALPIGGAMD